MLMPCLGWWDERSYIGDSRWLAKVYARLCAENYSSVESAGLFDTPQNGTLDILGCPCQGAPSEEEPKQFSKVLPAHIHRFGFLI